MTFPSPFLAARELLALLAICAGLFFAPQFIWMVMQ